MRLEGRAERVATKLPQAERLGGPVAGRAVANLEGPSRRARTPPRMGAVRKLALRIALVLIVAEVVWLIAANLALRTDLVERFVNRDPEKLLVKWDGGTSWYPVRIDVEGLAVLLRTSGVRIGIQAEDVGASLRLLPLLRGRAAFDRIRVEGLDVAIRRLPETAGEPDAPTPDAEAPEPDGEAPEPTKVAGAKPPSPLSGFRIDLEDVVVRGVEKISFDDMVVRGGEPVLETSLSVEIDGELQLRDADFDWTGAGITVGERNLADAIAVGFRGRTAPIDPRRDRGRALLGRIEAFVDVEGHVESLRPLALLLPDIAWIEELDGRGDVAVHVGFQEGMLTPGSTVAVDASGLALGFLGFRADGAGSVEAEVKETAGTTTARVEVAFSEFQLARQGEATVLARGEGLRLETRSEDLSQVEALGSYSAELEIPQSEVPDVSVFADRLPEGLGVEVHGGRASLSGHLAVDGGDEEAKGHVTLRGEGLRGRFRNMDFQIELAAETRVSGRDLDAYQVDLRGTEVRLFDGIFSSGETDVEEGWWMTVAVPEGHGSLRPPMSVEAEVELGMRDTRALVAVFAEVKRWIRHFAGILTVRDVAGTASVSLADEHLSVRGLSLVGDKLDVMAELELEKAESAGIFHAEFGVVSAGAERIGDETEFKLLNSRDWYEGRRAERWQGAGRQEALATPE